MPWPAYLRSTRLLAIAAAVLLPLRAAAPQGSDGPPPHFGGQEAAACAVPPGLEQVSRRLPSAARGLQPGSRLTVLAVGSALVGPRVGAAESFPQIMVQRLRDAAPGATVDLQARTERGATAIDMLAILRRELPAHPSSLLLWQTGTVDAARHVPIDAFGRALDEGARLAHVAGVDLVLIDAQYSRLLQDHVDMAPYERELARVATAPGVELFSRYALMQRWIEAGAIDVEEAPRRDRRRTIAELHGCLAAALADSIIRGAREASSEAVRQR